MSRCRSDRARGECRVLHRPLRHGEAVGPRREMDLLDEQRAAYGQPMGDTTDLPPYKNFLRQRRRLGAWLQARPSRLRATRSTIHTAATSRSRASFSSTAPRRRSSGTRRVSVSSDDVGNVFYKGNTHFCRVGDAGTPCNIDINSDGIVSSVPVDHSFDWKALRSSVEPRRGVDCAARNLPFPAVLSTINDARSTRPRASSSPSVRVHSDNRRYALS